MSHFDWKLLRRKKVQLVQLNVKIISLFDYRNFLYNNLKSVNFILDIVINYFYISFMKFLIKYNYVFK